MKQSATFIFHQMWMNAIKKRKKKISISSLHYLPPTEKPSPQIISLPALFPALPPLSAAPEQLWLLSSCFPPQIREIWEGKVQVPTLRAMPGHHSLSASTTTKWLPPLMKLGHGATVSPCQAGHVQLPAKHSSPSTVAKKGKTKKVLASITAARTGRASLPIMAPAWGSPWRGDRAG